MKMPTKYYVNYTDFAVVRPWSFNLYDDDEACVYVHPTFYKTRQAAASAASSKLRHWKGK
jgi:hypothetical protein